MHNRKNPNDGLQAVFVSMGQWIEFLQSFQNGTDCEFDPVAAPKATFNMPKLAGVTKESQRSFAEKQQKLVELLTCFELSHSSPKEDFEALKQLKINLKGNPIYLGLIQQLKAALIKKDERAKQIGKEHIASDEKLDADTVVNSDPEIIEIQKNIKAIQEKIAALVKAGLPYIFFSELEKNIIVPMQKKRKEIEGNNPNDSRIAIINDCLAKVQLIMTEQNARILSNLSAPYVCQQHQKMCVEKINLVISEQIITNEKLTTWGRWLANQLMKVSVIFKLVKEKMTGHGLFQSGIQIIGNNAAKFLATKRKEFKCQEITVEKIKTPPFEINLFNRYEVRLKRTQPASPQQKAKTSPAPK